MTKTLTTKALRALRDSLKSWRDGYDPVDDKEQYEMFVTAETAVGELLANREAQPVAVPEYLTYLREPIISNVLADDDNSPMANAARILAREVNFWRSQPLFTAPPAPAVPGEIGIQEAKELFNYLMTEEELNAIVNGYNACRAAMLAAAQGDH